MNLARKITDPFDILTLGVSGLKMDEKDVQSSMQNKKDNVSMAIYDVLPKCTDSQDNAREAYVNLCEALETVGMNYLIHESLGGK